MGFRFRKSINLGGGFRVNFSKSGVGYSWGTKGARITKTAKGKTRSTISIPGTGISYTTEIGKARKSANKYSSVSSTPHTVNTATSNANDRSIMNKTKKVSIWQILLWIIFLPVMGTIAIWKSHMKLWVKLTLTAIIWIFCLLVGSSSNKETASSTAAESPTYGTETPETAPVETNDIATVNRIEYVSSDDQISILNNTDTEVDFRIYPSDATADDIVVEIADNSIAVVDTITVENGYTYATATITITAIDAGNTTLLVKSADGNISSESMPLVVEKYGDIDILSYGFSGFEVGMTKSVSVECEPNGLTNDDITIANSNDTILSISNIVFSDDGATTVIVFDITALAEGDTSITVSTPDEEKNDSIDIHIDPKDTSRTVYKTPTGEKYHYSAACAGDNAIETTEKKAQEQYLEPCKNCT